MATLKEITYQNFKAYIENAETLMELKVYRLDGDRILKMFYVKHFFSSARIRPYSLRFLKNAETLSHLEIPTVQVLDIYTIQGESFSAVLYRELPGITLRDFLRKNPITVSLGHDLGNFFGELHEKGVLFRSIHLNNILLLENGRFALIDIADMKIYHRALSVRKRLRNFQHATRSEDDRKSLASVLEPFFEAYKMRCGITGRSEIKIHRFLKKLWNDPAGAVQDGSVQ